MNEETIVKATLFSKLPRWLRITLIVISIITLIYWVVFAFFKMWKYFGKALHWISDDRNWWIYTSVILLLVIGALFIAQFCSDLKPFTKLFNQVENLIHLIRKTIANFIA